MPQIQPKVRDLRLALSTRPRSQGRGVSSLDASPPRSRHRAKGRMHFQEHPRHGQL